MKLILSQILLAIALGGVAAAQTPPVQDWSPETIVVSAHRPGPLFWRVSRGGAEVWILGLVGPMPDGLEWDHSGLEQVIDGAKLVLLQPRAQVGLFEGLWFLMTDRSSLELPNDEHLETILPAPLKERFVAARTKLHRDGGRYEDDVPAWAGFMLYRDFLHDADLTADEPGKTVERLANHKDVPVHPIGTYEALPIVKDVGKMSDAASQLCLRDALSDIEAEDVHQKAAAEAWAKGDLAGMKANYSESTIFACLQQIPSFAAMWTQGVADTTKAIDAALAQDGKTVMVVNLGGLLRKDGILERLRAQGIKVEAPE